jgi:hypothetical protein
LVERNFEAVRVDVGDYGEVGVGTDGVVGVFVEGGGWVVDLVVAIGESTKALV